MSSIKIIQHKNPIRVCDNGDILLPFKSWLNTATGNDWYSKATEEYYKDKTFLPLAAIRQNPWEALSILGVNYFDFQEKVKYTCPYNKYVHFWAIPLLIFTDNIQEWLSKTCIPRSERYLDKQWVLRFFPLQTKNGFPFTKIHRALLGPGYTETALIDEGHGHLYDSIVSLDNGEMIGCKVWIWFNRR